MAFRSLNPDWGIGNHVAVDVISYVPSGPQIFAVVQPVYIILACERLQHGTVPRSQFTR